jgi:hypothetical protein
MSDANDSTKRAKKAPTGDYAVGFCRAPVDHQFKPGNKAAMRGRRKGSRNHKVIVREVLFEPVTVREGSEIKQMSVLEAVIKKTATKALAGDNKAALTIIGLAQRDGLLTPELEEAVEHFSETDKAIMEDQRRRLAGALPVLPTDIPTQPSSAPATAMSQAALPPAPAPGDPPSKPKKLRAMYVSVDDGKISYGPPVEDA